MLKSRYHWEILRSNSFLDLNTLLLGDNRTSDSKEVDSMINYYFMINFVI